MAFAPAPALRPGELCGPRRDFLGRAMQYRSVISSLRPAPMSGQPPAAAILELGSNSPGAKGARGSPRSPQRRHLSRRRVFGAAAGAALAAAGMSLPMASAGASASVAAAALPLRAPGSPLRPPEAAYRGSRHAHTGSIVYPRRVLLAPRTGAAGHAPAAGGPAAVTGAAGAGAMAAAAPLPSFLCNMAAGAVGRAVAVSVTHPIDTLKTRMQVQRGGARQGSAEALRGLLATSGVGGLYAGLDGSLVGQVPSSALAFAVYELARGAFSPLVPPDLHVPFTTACGSLGGLVGTLLVVPSEVVKTRLQTGVHATAGEAAGAILQEEGWAGFYRGCGIQLVRDVPFRALQLAAFEALRGPAGAAALPAALAESDLALGMLAGALAAALTTPLDVVKTRVMAQQRQAAAAPGGAGAAGYRGAGEALVRIAREEGPGALLRGLGPRVLAVAPMSALFLSVYETLRASLAAPAS